MRELDYSKVEEQIVSWLKNYAVNANVKGFVIGISGGVDSAVSSTLAAKTGLDLLVIQMPIRQRISEVDRATKHIEWLKQNFPNNVNEINCDLTDTFNEFLSNVHKNLDKEKQNLAEANTRSRLRMVTLYYYANLNNCLVLGTGNKVEDFGCGFFSKGGDGTVDLSPIGDLMKSEVRKLGKHMGVLDELVNAIAVDGLWGDARTDEMQIGATYDELEWAMEFIANNPRGFAYSPEDLNLLTDRQREVLQIYRTRHFANKHKMEMPPVCSVENLR